MALSTSCTGYNYRARGTHAKHEPTCRVENKLLTDNMGKQNILQHYLCTIIKLSIIYIHLMGILISLFIIARFGCYMVSPGWNFLPGIFLWIQFSLANTDHALTTINSVKKRYLFT